ncbi:lectin-like [Lissotriton helveticus]
MEESRRLGGASSRVLLLCVTLFLTVGWVNSDVTPEVLRENTYNRHHPDGGHRWKRKAVWHRRTNSCYRYISKKMPWGDAETFCQKLTPGSHLASAHNKEDAAYLTRFAFLRSHFHHGYWLGASDLYRKRHFQWTDGTPIDFKNWHPGEPFSSGGKEHCVCSNYKGQGLWGVLSCMKKFAFICKVRKPRKGKPFCRK